MKITIKSFKQLVNKINKVFGENKYKVVKLMSDEKHIEFALVLTCVMRTSYVIMYRKDLNTFTDIIGIFERPSQSFIWWLNKVNDYK